MGAGVLVSQTQQPGKRVRATDHAIDHLIDRCLQLILIKSTAASHLASGHGQTAEHIVHCIAGSGDLFGQFYGFFIHSGLNYEARFKL